LGLQRYECFVKMQKKIKFFVKLYSVYI
jgi:hypothetical protein